MQFLSIFSASSHAQGTGPLRVCQANPRYFTDNTGKAIYLTGSHTWANLIDQGDVSPPPAFEWNQYLDWLQGTGQNYLRLWIREHYLHTCEIPSPATWYLSPESMFKRSTTGGANGGGNKFNLDSLDNTWFARLRQRCIDARNHGIYVDIVLFDGWSVWRRVAFNVFDYHPYSASNNVNGVNGDPDGDHNGNVHTVNAAWNTYQFKYVKRLIDEVNDLDNILYEIGNECAYPSASQTDPWIRMMVDTIHAYELRKPKQHPVGYTGDWTIPNSYLTSVDNHSEFIAFGAGNNGTAYQTDPPAATGNKVVILDTDHLWGVPDGSDNGSRKWIWKSFTRGHNVNSMDPWNSASYGNFAGTHFDTSQTWWRSFRMNLGYANTYARKMNLTAMTPQNSLSSTTYCLANPSATNAEYLIYRPLSTGAITVNLSATADSLNVEWFNPATGIVTLSAKVPGGASRSFTAPFSGDAVLLLSAASSSPSPLTIPMTLGTGWNLVSIPLSMSNDSASVLFPDKAGSVSLYNTETKQYTPTQTLKCGEGYWVNYQVTDSLAVNGFPQSTLTTTAATNGWVLIGSKETPIQISSLILSNGASILGSAFWFDSISRTYIAKTIIHPGIACWINVSKACTITLP